MEGGAYTWKVAVKTEVVITNMTAQAITFHICTSIQLVCAHGRLS